MECLSAPQRVRAAAMCFLLFLSACGANSSAVVGTTSTARSASTNADVQTKALLEQRLVGLLGAKARFSAREAQGRGVMFCRPDQTSDAVLSVFSQDERDHAPRCFAVRADSSRYNTLRDFEESSVSMAVAALPSSSAEFAWQMNEFGGHRCLFAMELGGQTKLLRVPMKPGVQPLSNEQIFARFDDFADLDQAAADVVVGSREQAVNIDLREVRAHMLARLRVETERFVERERQKEERRLDAMQFPPDGMKRPALAQMLRGYLATHQSKTDIDPASVLKISVSSAAWERAQQPDGREAATVRLAVGFEHAAGRCAYAVYTLQRDLRDGQLEPESRAYISGKATAWTNIRCERLK